MTRCWRVEYFQEFGKVKIWMCRDERLGQCVFEDGFVTPNMPKLHYAIKFQGGSGFMIHKDLNEEIKKFNVMYVFEKRDGFNLLFYKYKNKIIPKTRMLPRAGGKTSLVVKDKDFPLETIKKVVNDGYVPYFEVWGTKVENKYRIPAGDVNKTLAQKINGLPSLNVELIWVWDFENKQFLHPIKIVELAEQYGLAHAPYFGKHKVSVITILDLMDKAEQQNLKYNDIVIEGFVAHCFLKGEYKMFKIKPPTVMKKHVTQVRKLIPLEAIKREIGKIIVEVDVEELAKEPIKHLKTIFEYLREDFMVSKKDRKNVMYVFTNEIAKEIVKQNLVSSLEDAGRKGYHKMVIGALARYFHKR